MSTWHRVAGALTTPPAFELYCDGSAAERAARPGAWAFCIVRAGKVVAEGTGTAPRTTSLEMELHAVRAALRALLERGGSGDAPVELISDSSIALDVAAGRFVPKGFDALAAELRALAAQARATTRWVRGHAGHRWNEHVDALAGAAKVREG